MYLVAISGTTRGLGHAAAAVFRSNGWTVLELSRPEFDLKHAGEIADAAFDRFAGRPPERAVLVNNACSFRFGRAAVLEPETIEAELAANVIGSIQLMTRFIRRFPTGEVVEITSRATVTDFEGWSLYGVAKAAVARYVQAMAAEGVKARCFDPGAMDTGMQAAIRREAFAGVERFVELHRDSQLASPESVAQRLLEFVGDPSPRSGSR